MSDTPLEPPGPTSFCQLVQELIAGVVRRHVFTGPELELLLDVETSGIRKSARPEVLRSYLKALQIQLAEGSAPLRFAAFLERKRQRVTRRVSVPLKRIAARHGP